MQQVRFAQADAAVQQQRVVQPTAVFADQQGRGACQAVGLSLDEGVELQLRIHGRRGLPFAPGR